MKPNRFLRTSFGLGLAIAGAVITPACFFPDFSFNETGGTGGATTTSIAGGGTGGTTTSHTTGGTTGGTGGTTTTSMGGTTTGGTGGATGGTTSSGGGGATGGSTTGGTGGMTTTSSSSSTMTMPPVEDCSNGVDDDGDSLIDCKDTADCADFTCVSSVPAGWTGYFQIFQGLPADDPGCSPEYPNDAYAGNFNLNAPPANCNACLCGMPQGETCSPPSTINVLDCACGGTPTVPLPLTMPNGWTGTCASALDGMGQGYYYPGNSNCGPDMAQPCNQAVTAPAPTVTGGFCASSGGGGMVPMAHWDGFARACNGASTMGAGCNLSQKCLPKPKSPYSALICIKRAGDFNCPAGQFSQKQVFYDDFTDSRACSACSCDAPSGSTCAGNISIYSDTFLNACSIPAATFPAGGCAFLSANPPAGNSKFAQTQAPNGGSCAPIGGQPVGQATKTFPQTFCCMPAN